MDPAMRKEAAFAEALEPRLRNIYSYFRRLGVDAASAEDLAQETLLLAWQNLSSLRDETKLKGWLYRIAYRCFLKHRTRRPQATVEIPEKLPGAAMYDPGSDERLVMRVAHQALLTLPPKHLHALALVYWEGLSYAEAARVLSVPVGTLAWRVHKALKLAKRALAEKEAEDEVTIRGPQASRAVDGLDES